MRMFAKVMRVYAGMEALEISEVLLRGSLVACFGKEEEANLKKQIARALEHEMDDVVQLQRRRIRTHQ